jgi:hypothetical protein
MLWLCLLLVTILLIGAWLAFAKPRLPVVGMTVQEVELILGPGGYPAPFGKAKFWDTDTGQIWVDFDDQRRVCEVKVLHEGGPRKPNLWERFREWLGF